MQFRVCGEQKNTVKRKKVNKKAGVDDKTGAKFNQPVKQGNVNF